ncbi:Amino-terminal Zinc-binding domain-containing protein [Phytophthora infestans]|uniref:Amino-terminal Zinc-binding domain-containing protein n=1 Tax=Phytophthora infestans TaxID=4787 RepID=A0A833SPA7_PHYIN|nr:Amino-terminal Zinc-binding domain-containing protein [Phytophthora infestans]
MDHDQVGDVSNSSDAVASTAHYAYARQLVQAYFAMLTVGCQRDICPNTNCCSNPHTRALTATEAAIKSIYFATTTPVSLCIEIAPGQQHEGVVSSTSELPLQKEIKITATPEPREMEQEDNQLEDTVLPFTGDNKQDLHPETPDDVPKIQALQNDTAPATPTTSSPPKSTPRRRLSVAVQLDSGLNKNRDLQVKRPTVITRVAVQPKHKPDIDPTVSVSEADTSSVAEQQQQHEK